MSDDEGVPLAWLEEADESLLDLVDHVINKGVVLSGEVVLGIAGVDLVYLRLAAVVGAADRILGAETSGRQE